MLRRDVRRHRPHEVDKDPGEDRVLRQIEVRTPTQLVEEADVLEVRDLPVHPLFRQLTFFQNFPRLQGVIVLQVEGSL